MPQQRTTWCTTKWKPHWVKACDENPCHYSGSHANWPNLGHINVIHVCVAGEGTKCWFFMTNIIYLPNKRSRLTVNKTTKIWASINSFNRPHWVTFPCRGSKICRVRPAGAAKKLEPFPSLQKGQPYVIICTMLHKGKIAFVKIVF